MLPVGVLAVVGFDRNSRSHADNRSAAAAIAAAPRERAPAPPPPALPPKALPLDGLAARSALVGPVTDIFALPAPAPTAPVMAATPPAPAPQAPRFPYVYLGAMVDGGARTGFFSRGDEVLALRNGDVVDGKFRVDALEANALTLTYLPLDQPQVVAYGSPR